MQDKEIIKKEPVEIKGNPVPVGKGFGIRVMMNGKNRNKPCPCGSGVKFKKCHGAKYDGVVLMLGKHENTSTDSVEKQISRP